MSLKDAYPDRRLIIGGPDHLAMGGTPPECPTCGQGMEVFLDGKEHCDTCEPQMRSGIRARNVVEILPRAGAPRR